MMEARERNYRCSCHPKRLSRGVRERERERWRSDAKSSCSLAHHAKHCNSFLTATSHSLSVTFLSFSPPRPTVPSLSSLLLFLAGIRREVGRLSSDLHNATANAATPRPPAAAGAVAIPQ